MESVAIEVIRMPQPEGTCVVVLRGSVNDAGTLDLQQAIAGLRAENVKNYVIDLEHVQFISSAGMSALVTLSGDIEALGGSVALVKTGPRVQAMFDTLGMSDFFRRFGNREDATRSFGRRAPEAPQSGPAPGTSDTWTSPLAQRYAGKSMLACFSDFRRFTTWRDLWIALAESQRALGLPVTEAQIAELKAARNRVDAKRAAEIERETRHDVMAHIRHYGEQAPGAAGIIHLGATSMFVVDNTDLVLVREALDILIRKVARVCRSLAKFAKMWREFPAMGFTHFQPAQVTTVGRRACLWLQDFLMDLRELRARRESLRFLGVKGAIGTQASFLALFEGDRSKVETLDRLVAERMGFSSTFRITGQTYTRKLDSQVMAALSGIAQSASKFSNDIRLAQSRFEMQEPFGKGQVGSSAMAYKQNPMRSERIAGLARFVMVLETNMPLTAGAQWFERTLDDSANKRLSVPEAFLATDAILNLVVSVVEGLVVYPKVVTNNLRQELPFLATEDLLMAAVKAGGDRQQLHEVIRTHSVAAAQRVREEGLPNDLVERLKRDAAFAGLKVDWATILEPGRYTGRAAEQVELFLAEEVEPALKDVPEADAGDLDVRV